MPHPYIEAETSPSSRSSANYSSPPPEKRAQFTKSKQSSSEFGSPRPENSSNSTEWLSLEATEPFPPDLFRVPVPNAVFARMPELSDSALRCLLALLHLSFRFDPVEDTWVHSGDWFARSDVEGECGLSNQGTRNGLAELESIGGLRVDRSARSHQYQLALDVPTEKFTYVPAALLENVGGINSATELRVILAVIRETWGWTCKAPDPKSGQEKTVHDLWAQLSTRDLAEATGRSETAAGQAATALQGEWIERVRPGHGAYQYRFLPEAVGDGSEEPNSFSGADANDMTPHRQNSAPPTFNKESCLRDKHDQTEKRTEAPPGQTEFPRSEDAVPAKNVPESEVFSTQEAPPPRSSQNSRRRDGPPDFTDLPPKKQTLAEKLRNVGVWAGRIAELLSRFSPERIQANFELYRRRTAKQTIRKPGAWLYRAITDGYVLPTRPSTLQSSDPPDSPSASTTSALPPLDHKQTVSEAEKDAYVRRGVDEEQFHRCLTGGDGPNDPRFMYFDPNVGEPTPRI